MSTVTSRHGGFVHGVGFYATDEDFVQTFAPFCEAGLEAGEPTIVRVEARKADLLRSAIGDTREIEFMSHRDQYPQPPGALTAALDLIERHLSNGTRRLRLLGSSQCSTAWRATPGSGTRRPSTARLPTCPCTGCARSSATPSRTALR